MTVTYNFFWKKLPSELAWAIFNQIDRKQDLLQCMLTSKVWNQLVQKTAYQNVYLDCNFSENIEIFTNTLSESTNQHGTLVRSITLHSSANLSVNHPPIYDIKKALYKLLICLRKNCPGLRAINLDLDKDLLLGLENSFWQGLKNKEWTHLELLAICDKEIVAIADKYTDIAMFYKENLKTLELYSSKPIDITAEGSKNKSFDLLKKGLSQFTSLNHLKIEVNSNNNIFQFDSLVSHSLESLEINTILDNCTYVSLEKGQKILDSNILNIKKCSNLRQLVLQTVFNSNYAIKYLMHTFPCLKSLEINVCTDANTSATLLWKQSVFLLLEDTMNNFAEYLVMIRHFEIDNIYLINQVDLIETLIKKSATQEANYYISLDYEAYINTDFDADANSLQRIKIGKNTKKILSKTGKNTIDNVDLYSIDVNVSNNVPSGEILLQSAGNHLVGLKIKETTNNDWSLKKLDLDSMLSHYPNLMIIELHNVEPVLQNHNTVEENESIRTLILKECKVSLEFFSQLSRQFPNLKTLRLLGRVFFVDSHGNEQWKISLSKLIANMPNLKTLEIENPCQHLYDCSKIEKNNSIETMVLGFTSLDIFPTLSASLPNLKSLQLLGSISIARQYEEEVLNHLQEEYTINIPHTSLYSFSFSLLCREHGVTWCKCPKPDSCRLKVSSVDSGELFYSSKISQNCDDAHFMKKCKNIKTEQTWADKTPNVFHLSIVCKEPPKDIYCFRDIAIV